MGSPSFGSCSTRSGASAIRTHSLLSALDRAPVWLNSDPLTVEGLRGSVVAVDFWTYSCVNWLRTLPYLRAWDERYRDRGLVVVGVHAPEFGFEHDLDNVRRAAGELGVAYPVVIDNDFAIWRSFDNRYWPALYLVREWVAGMLNRVDRRSTRPVEAGSIGGLAGVRQGEMNIDPAPRLTSNALRRPVHACSARTAFATAIRQADRTVCRSTPTSAPELPASQRGVNVATDWMSGCA